MASGRRRFVDAQLQVEAGGERRSRRRSTCRPDPAPSPGAREPPRAWQCPQRQKNVPAKRAGEQQDLAVAPDAGLEERHQQSIVHGGSTTVLRSFYDAGPRRRRLRGRRETAASDARRSCDEVRCRVAEERGDDVFVLLGLARAGANRAGGRRGLTRSAARAQQLALRRGKARQSSGDAPPADVRIAADRAQARTRRIDQDQIEGVDRERQRPVGGDVNDRDVARPGIASSVPRQQPHALRRARRRRRRDPRSRIDALMRERLAARRRAQIEHRSRRLRGAASSPISCDASSCTMKRPSVNAACIERRDRRCTSSPCGARPCRLASSTPSRSELFGERFARGQVPIDGQAQRRRLIVERAATPSRRALAVAARATARRATADASGRPTGDRSQSSRDGHASDSRSRDSARSTAFARPAALDFAGATRQLDRIVDHRRRRQARSGRSAETRSVAGRGGPRRRASRAAASRAAPAGNRSPPACAGCRSRSRAAARGRARRDSAVPTRAIALAHVEIAGRRSAASASTAARRAGAIMARRNRAPAIERFRRHRVACAHHALALELDVDQLDRRAVAAGDVQAVGRRRVNDRAGRRVGGRSVRQSRAMKDVARSRRDSVNACGHGHSPRIRL